MLPQEVIRAKRDGHVLAEADLAAFVAGFTSGAVTEAQAAAFAMAVFFRGLADAECVALTRAMTRSGAVLSWDGLPGPVLDKHSTGGVGDTVSLMLAPALAACGAFVPMISGRGLGHTGGTLDKLDSIPGYGSQPDLDLFRATVRAAGCAIIGQTPDLAPADRRLYAIRDVTATVESIPLITASILSKKLAAGLHGLVMDVKFGSGAFMRDQRQARALAASLASVASDAGLPTVALLSDMDRPLADVAGNALEMRYAVDYLTGRRREPRMHELVLALGGEALCLGGLAASPADGETLIERAIASGAAAERFARMVGLLGGPADLLERPQAHLAAAPVSLAVHADAPGIVASVDMYALGMAVVALGGGRTRPQDAVDMRVGLSALAAPGDDVDAERPLALIHAADRAAAEAVAVRVRAAYRIGARYGAIRPVVAARITGGEQA
mgnify:CR=1 FL=1